MAETEHRNTINRAGKIPRFARCANALVAVALWLPMPPIVTTGSPPDIALEPRAELQFLYNNRSPIWMGPFIRYSVFEQTTVEARFYALGGELIHILRLGEQRPGQYTLPFDGTMENGAVKLEGKYYFELYFGDEFATEFWFICRSLDSQSAEEQQ